MELDNLVLKGIPTLDDEKDRDYTIEDMEVGNSERDETVKPRFSKEEK